MTTEERLTKLEAAIKPAICPECRGLPFSEMLTDRTLVGGPPAPKPTPQRCPLCGNEQKLIWLVRVVPSRKVDE